MIFIRPQSYPLLSASLVLIYLQFSCSHLLLAQAVSGRIEAIASEPYGVARMFIPVGQLATTTTLRILVSDTSDRVMFPAVDLLTDEPPEVHSAPSGDRLRLGNGALIGRIRGAIQNAKEQIDPLELVRVQFLFRGVEPFQVHLSGDIETTLEVIPIKLLDPVDATDTAKRNSEKLRRHRSFRLWSSRGGMGTLIKPSGN